MLASGILLVWVGFFYYRQIPIVSVNTEGIIFLTF